MRSDCDQTSVFSYKGAGESDEFSLHSLNDVVHTHFGKRCGLLKLAEGGYHKVYDVVEESGTSLDAVARVCSPAFPVDKLRSEVATIKYIASHTKIPVPHLYLWDTDAGNKVGAEYMVMQKIPGVSAGAIWDELSLDKKKLVVTQVAHHLHALFLCRFKAAGSLYMSSETEFVVGPIVSVPFYRAVDGFVRVPDWESYSQELHPVRGPFENTTDYLKNQVVPEQYFVSRHRAIALEEAGSEEDLKQGERVLTKLLDLCSVFPGDRQVHAPVTTAEEPFSIMLDDFNLSNIMIDEQTAEVTGLIDFEGTTIAPIWACAVIPRWLQPIEGPESCFEGGPDDLRGVLRETFTEAIGNVDSTGEWMSAYRTGRPYRIFLDHLHFNVNVWATLESWVDKRAEWSRSHPDVQFDDELDDE